MKSKVFLGLAILLAIAGIGAVSYAASSKPESQPPRHMEKEPISPLADDPSQPASPVKLIFIHHSTGGNWLADIGEHDQAGGLGQALMDNNYFVSATNYGWSVGGDAIGDRTDIPNWPEWFTDTIMSAVYTETGQNIGGFGDWSRMADPNPSGENEIVMFKSCFPNSDLYGNPNDPPLFEPDDSYTVANAKAVYNEILAYFEAHQNKLFIVITAPPMAEGEYTLNDPGTPAAERAANARAFNNWLLNEWLASYPHTNVAVFDYYNVLTSNGSPTRIDDTSIITEPNDYNLRPDGNHHYWNGSQVTRTQTISNNFSAYPSYSDGPDWYDSHPMTNGQQKATAEFVPLLNVFYNRWKGGTTCVGITDVSISGPIEGYTGTLYTFAAAFMPANASAPITYTWEPEPDSGQSSASASYTWATTGTKIITVTAENCGGSGTDNHAITITPPNQAPYTPTNPIPANDATSVPVTQTLSWQGGDPDGDPVTYTLALGTSDPPPFAATTVLTSYTPALANGTAYYWAITATDGISAIVGPTWSFTTATAPPTCPYPLEDVSISGPIEGYTGTLYTFATVIIPSDATPPITYTWSPTPTFGQGEASTAYRWDTPGAYTLTLVAENCTPPSTVAVSDTHTIVITSTPPVGDAYEPDDTCAQARPIPVDGTMQSHTFHAPDDRDWVAFEVISGTEYLIEAQTPVDSLADVAVALFDQCGGLSQGGQDHAFTPDVRLLFTAPTSGTFYLRLKNHDTTVGGPDLRYNLSVRALSQESTQGVLVLVAGRLKPNDPVQENIYQVTDDVYRLFLQKGGYDNERIYYLSNDQNRDPDDNDFTQDVDAYATKADLQSAITVWAMDKVGPDQAFTLYLMDHGTPDKVYLDGRSDTVSPTELDGWLGELEANNPSVRVNVIIEACHSGSFIDQLGKDGRVIIASTGSQAVAYATERGAIFSDVFVNALERGMSLYGGYEEARGTTVQAHPDQSPGLDDDGDGQANDPDDGTEAALRGFAYAGTFPGPDNWPPYIVWATVSLTSTPEVELQPNQGLLQAEVQDDTRVFAVWAVVYKPSYVPPDPSTTEEIVEEHLPTVTMLDQDSDDVYTAIYEGFTEPGRYRIVIYAVDTEEVLGRPRVVEVLLGGHQVYLPLVVRND